MSALLSWAKTLPEWQEMQHAVDERRPAFVEDQDKMDLNKFWAERLKKERPGAFDSISQLQGMLMPALEQALCMNVVGTPVQKVRLWAEALMQAESLIQAQLVDSELGGPDVPSIVLFLTCICGCPDLVYHIKESTHIMC